MKTKWFVANIVNNDLYWYVKVTSFGEGGFLFFVQKRKIMMADQNDLTIDYIIAELSSIDYGSIVITI